MLSNIVVDNIGQYDFSLYLVDSHVFRRTKAFAGKNRRTLICLPKSREVNVGTNMKSGSISAMYVEVQVVGTSEHYVSTIHIGQGDFPAQLVGSTWYFRREK